VMEIVIRFGFDLQLALVLFGGGGVFVMTSRGNAVYDFATKGGYRLGEEITGR
jgi:predicted Rdx family selenoprotein